MQLAQKAVMQVYRLGGVMPRMMHMMLAVATGFYLWSYIFMMMKRYGYLH